LLGGEKRVARRVAVAVGRKRGGRRNSIQGRDGKKKKGVRLWFVVGTRATAALTLLLVREGLKHKN